MRVMKRNTSKPNDDVNGNPIPIIDVKDVTDNVKEVDIVKESIRFAVDAHQGQIRKYTKLPYVFHCFDVAKRAKSYLDKFSVNDDDFTAACILHDVLEDTKVTGDQIKDVFGSNVLNIVQAVTRPANESNDFADKYRYLKNFKNKSKEAIVLKIADRVCNVMDFLQDPETAWYALRYALQAYPVYRAYADCDNISPKVISEIAGVENLIRMRYNVSIYMSSEQEIEVALGIGKQNK